jgi:hypothetical protein
LPQLRIGKPSILHERAIAKQPKTGFVVELAAPCERLGPSGVRFMPLHEVVQELGHRHHATDQEIISGPSAGDVKQVELGVVNFLQIGVIADSLYALL